MTLSTNNTGRSYRWLMGKAASEWRASGPLGVLGSVASVVRARWQLRRASTLGHARVWGRVLLRNWGDLAVEDRVRLEGTTVPIELVCGRGAELRLGEGTYVNYGTNISATRSVRIGRDCAIGQYSIIMDNDYHSTEDIWSMGEPAPVVIEDHVWIGARVIVLRGAHIGEGSIIGANSVVKGTIPPGSLAAGSPARVIRSREGVLRHDPR